MSKYYKVFFNTQLWKQITPSIKDYEFGTYFKIFNTDQRVTRVGYLTAFTSEFLYNFPLYLHNCISCM